MPHAARTRDRARPRLGLGVAVGLSGIAFGGVAEANRQPPSPRPGPRVALTPRSGPAGTSVSVRGSGFRPRVRGVVVFGRRRVGSFSATRSGGFFLRFK